MSKFDYAVIMPKMSMTMEEGELLGIRVEVGQAVKSGDVLFDVATDKIDMEVESPSDGIVKEIIGQIGSTMLVGAPVLVLLTDTPVMSFDFNSPALPEVATVVSTPIVEITAETPMVAAIQMEPIAVRAVPKARVVAKSQGIDLRAIAATGPFGTITYEDVANPHNLLANDARKVSNRKMIASAIQKTRDIPQMTLSGFSTHTTASVEEGSAHLISTWARILRSNSHLNISTIDEKEHLHIGVALIMESKYGLAIPVFKDPDFLSGTDLLQWIESTRQQSRLGKVPVEMLSGATASIFDVSHTKISSAIPLLLPSHTTALAVGAPRAAFAESEICLTVDLRFCGALEAAQLLDHLIDTL
jgi:pyruvate dehydrogenase E2 component (dihydrolipoamide acetyltransferase)